MEYETLISMFIVMDGFVFVVGGGGEGGGSAY